jgi:hypothetical protein
MSRRGDAGRFTGNPETQGNATEEENSIERAFAAANGLDEVMMGGTQTPMPSQKREFAGSPRQEAERTVLATRKKAQLTERLNKITEEIEATEQEAARELFAESWGTPGEGDRRQRTPERATESPDNGSSSESEEEEPDCAESIEYLLQEFGEMEDLSMNRDTLHRMFAKVQLTKLQPKLNEHLGRRNKIGSMHVLMEEVRKVFRVEVEQFKKDSLRRTHKLREKVQEFQTLLMIETKMRPVVASLVVAKIWSDDSEASVSQPIRDVAQSMGRSSDWDSIKEGCAAGEMDQDLLTDEPVEGLAGYEELVCGDSSRMDKSWVKLIINTAVLMSYEQVIRQTWTQAVNEWTIVAPGHDLCQKAGENVNDLLARLRCSLVKLQKELRRLGKLDKLPDEEAMVRQHMLAVYSHTRYKMVDFMVVDGTRKEELTLKETVAMMRKAEDAVSINGYEFESSERPAGKGAGGGKGADGRDKGGGSREAAEKRAAAITKADRARSAYARANSMQVTDVTREMISRLGEDHWESRYVRKTFRDRRPGAHPMGAASDRRTRQQKEAEQKVLDGELPKPKPKPSMHHIQMGAGWKKRLGKSGAGMHFMSVEAAEDDRENSRLHVEIDAYSRKYKKLSWLSKWSKITKANKAQVWLDAWLGKRKAPESEMPQVMVMPGRSGAGGDGSDPHQRQYENKDFDEADGQDAESSDEDATDGSQEQGTGDGSDGGQCGCQGPDGQHRCEAVAVEGDRCELCLLGCAPGEGTQSAEHYRKCTCATEECTGCICGCECVGCINRKRLHAAANRDTLQGEHQQHADRYAGEDRYSRHPGSHVGSINAGGGSDRLYLDEEVSGRRRWDGTPECVNSWAELHFWMERCKWRSWALMGLEIAHMMPADGVTAFESKVWERMDTDPDEYEVPLRELVHRKHCK